MTSGAVAREGVRRQVSAAVRWSASVEKMIAAGVTTFIEVGPGKVLCGLIKSISKDVQLCNVENKESLEACLQKIAVSNV